MIANKIRGHRQFNNLSKQIQEKPVETSQKPKQITLINMYGTVGLLRDRRELLRHCHKSVDEIQSAKVQTKLQKPLSLSPASATRPNKIVQHQKPK